MTKNNNLPEQIRLGRNASSKEAKAPKSWGKQAKINTNLPEINWTPNKLTITVIVLLLPYLLAVAVSFASGNYLIAGVFIGLGFLVVGIYFLLRYIERSDL